MKYLITIFLVVLIFINGCGSEEPETQPESAQPESSPQALPESTAEPETEPQAEKPSIELDLSTSEKTFDIYINAVESDDLDLFTRVFSDKHKQAYGWDLNILQQEIDKGNSLSYIIYNVEPDAFIIKIDEEDSNLPYDIEFDVGSRRYEVNFVFEDNEWRIGE